RREEISRSRSRLTTWSPIRCAAAGRAGREVRSLLDVATPAFFASRLVRHGDGRVRPAICESLARRRSIGFAAFRLRKARNAARGPYSHRPRERAPKQPLRHRQFRLDLVEYFEGARRKQFRFDRTNGEVAVFPRYRLLGIALRRPHGASGTGDG